jgi:hypothetical protein
MPERENDVLDLFGFDADLAEHDRWVASILYAIEPAKLSANSVVIVAAINENRSFRRSRRPSSSTTTMTGDQARAHRIYRCDGLLILPNVSHFGFLQDPKMFTFAILRFLGAATNRNAQVAGPRAKEIDLPDRRRSNNCSKPRGPTSPSARFWPGATARHRRRPARSRRIPPRHAFVTPARTLASNCGATKPRKAGSNRCRKPP